MEFDDNLGFRDFRFTFFKFEIFSLGLSLRSSLKQSADFCNIFQSVLS